PHHVLHVCSVRKAPATPALYALSLHDALPICPQVGAKLNEVTKEVTALLGERRSHLEHREAEERLQAERIDMTLPAIQYPLGVLHVIQQTIDEITDIFTSIGYAVADGPEAELAWYNFDAL